MKTRTNFITMVPKFPNPLHNTFASAWLGLAIGSRTYLRSVRVMNHANQLQCIEPQEDRIFLA
jgi:hypothetical protein